MLDAPKVVHDSAPKLLLKSFGFPYCRRLSNGRELREISRQGRRIRDALFSVHTRKNELGHPRLGITVSRKVSTNSVIRNRIKRCVRESFRVHQNTIASIDLVVIAQPAAGNTTMASLRESLQRHWQNAG